MDYEAEIVRLFWVLSYVLMAGWADGAEVSVAGFITQDVASSSSSLDLVYMFGPDATNILEPRLTYWPLF